MSNSSVRQYAASSSNGIVADGYERAIRGIAAKLRVEIEQKYSAQWNASGLIQRWWISRKMEREINALAKEQAKHISKSALY